MLKEESDARLDLVFVDVVFGLDRGLVFDRYDGRAVDHFADRDVKGDEPGAAAFPVAA